MSKIYRLKKNIPELRAGAILKKSPVDSGRYIVENLDEVSHSDRGVLRYINADTVENASYWFEQVYALDDLILTKPELERLRTLAQV